MYKKTTHKEFIEKRDQLPSELLVFLTPYTVDEYEKIEAVTYLSDDKRSGYALADGELISVFSLPGASQGKKAILDAIKKGAVRLDCIDGFLPALYRAFGFCETGRIVWNDAYAPKNWDYSSYGRPDIVFMAIK